MRAWVSLKVKETDMVVVKKTNRDVISTPHLKTTYSPTISRSTCKFWAGKFSVFSSERTCTQFNNQKRNFHTGEHAQDATWRTEGRKNLEIQTEKTCYLTNLLQTYGGKLQTPRGSSDCRGLSSGSCTNSLSNQHRKDQPSLP
jgi:hypothetical protein